VNGGEDQSFVADGNESLARCPESGRRRADEKDLLAVRQSIDTFTHPFRRIAIQNLIKICKLIVNALNF
jgi:hypothetical protein